MTSAHDKYDDAQHLCDRLRDALSTGIDDLTRKEGQHWCSYGTIGSSNFAYISHNQHKLRVYLRCAIDDKQLLEDSFPPSSTVAFNQRKTITPKQWSALTPYFVDLHNEQEILEIAPLLESANERAHRKRQDARAAPRGPRIIVYGHGDRSPFGLPNPNALIDFIKNGVVENSFRYHYTQNKNADVIILSQDGLAFGHFEIANKELPNDSDREQYAPVKCVYIVGTRASYSTPVRLFPILGKQVTSFGLFISVSQFDQIKKLAGDIREFQKADLSSGWPASPDIAHNAAVEAAAIACVRKHLGPLSRDRQKDNCGWDLEFWAHGRTLCVEVKGLAGPEIGVELTPNEYAAMTRAMNGTFTEGDYRLAIVCKALSDVPIFFLFKHDKEMCWRCEHSQCQITVSQRIAARLS